MEVIKERNNPDPVVYLFIIIAFGSNIILYLWSKPAFFYMSCIITFLICIFQYLRIVEFIIDKNKIKLKFSFCSILYKIIDADFDTVKISSSDTLTFYKNQSELLSIQYVDDIDEQTYTLGSIEIISGQKRFDIGNKKTSFNLFKKIKIAVSNYNVLAET